MVPRLDSKFFVCVIIKWANRERKLCGMHGVPGLGFRGVAFPGFPLIGARLLSESPSMDGKYKGFRFV
jgi:hypothetical protein